MKNSPSGVWKKSPTGYKAFVPHPLPPEIKWSRELVHALSDADRLIGKLAGEGRRLPNPHLLMRPFLAKEAVLSSKIEGTQATLGELLASEAGAVVERSPDDLREVGNYVTAMEHGVKLLKKLPISLRFVRELHGKLMHKVRGELATPGEFRHTQNWIGVPGSTIMTASYVPPSPDDLMNCLGEWEKFLHDKTLPPLVQIALAHYQFEAIHPFLDGNGRVGRLLIILMLMDRDILPAPLLYISAFFENHRRDYYDRLNGISMQGEWDQWLLYFLNGIARQSEDASKRAEKINTLIDEWKTMVAAESSPVPLQLVEMLSQNPYLTINKASKELKVAFTTVQRGIGKLEKHGIVIENTGGKRERVYCAKKLLDVLEA